MAKSIMQTEKECYLCRRKANLIGWKGNLPSTGLHRHHVVFGSADRRISEKLGLWVWVCAEKHHVYGPESPHGNQKVAELLIRDGQRAFEEKYDHETWMELFGKNYL